MLKENALDIYKSDIQQEIMKKDSLYNRTGIVMLVDEEEAIWYYHRKYGVLISSEPPESWNQIVYGASMSIVGKIYSVDVLKTTEAKEIFESLSKMRACQEWHIDKKIWKIGTNSFRMVYDGKQKVVRLRTSDDNRIYLLKTKYIRESRQFLRENDINDWKEDCYSWKVFNLKIMKSNNTRSTQTNLKMNKKAETKDSNLKITKKDLLDCDKRRCRLESYEENILYDIKCGHWDLYGENADDIQDKDDKMLSRDPRKDIKNGVIGIDFGTKSTVVVKQDETNKIVPIRIGTGKLTAEVKESDFENPTVIEFTDLKAFLDSYNKKMGRPDTTCEDCFISYDAYNDFKQCLPNEFYAYYDGLKQWTNKEKTEIVIKDKRQNEFKFSYEKIADVDVNPIELYAYYIGLYINNMRNGIYMKYLMSFPVGYPKETREFIRSSFETGIKKSLPTTILNDSECMEKFEINLGISEPAAYAVTALTMSDLDPQDENERYMYGIFDFGGGTTDFDFGTWRGASENEYEIEGYDYVLECFGAGSDNTLGGENILELISYYIFRKNIEQMRSKRIVCSLPVGEEKFLGSEMLICNSQIAMRNMSILKEELRPLWYQEEGWRSRYLHDSRTNSNAENSEEECIITLYDIDGKPQPNCTLKIDSQELIAVIKNRIQKGVDAFFKCMESTFLLEKEAQKEENKVYIFLAGNASKSRFVKELFEDKIQEYYKKFKEINEKTVGHEYFELVEPLQDCKNEQDTYIPNAKTSVAYGLLKCREGSSIKIIKNYETNPEEETRFLYYLGRERRNKFDCKLSPLSVEYNKWIQFQGAVKEIIRIYYTSNPLADNQNKRNNQISIDNIPYKEIKITPEQNKYVFIRTITPSEIEYTIASAEEEILEKGNEINKLDLNM